MSHTAFLTGATGFLGAELAHQLLDAGWKVTALVRASSDLSPLEGLPLDLRTGDLTDAASLRAAMPEQPDAVFHVGASTSIWSREKALQTRINVDGTQNLIDVAVAAGAQRFIHTSSFVVWGFQSGTLTEATPWTGPEDEWINYLRTKRVAERLIKQAVDDGRLDAVICNPGHILGPGDRYNWSRMIRLVNSGKLPGVPPGSGAFADVREVARAHLAAWERGRAGENYLLGGPVLSFLELIGIMGELLNKPVPAKASPAWQLTLAARLGAALAARTGKAPDLTPEGAAMVIRHMHADSSKAQQELGYRYTPPRQLLEDTCRWMQAQGLLA
ncbi:MAG: SDR family oxidoreductase [Xanthomonadales bacterium]|nr:SDR family oxidoreductase [Xanthomonadales bacterium]